MQQAKRGLLELLDLQARLQKTIVFVSHDLRAVSATCDRIACLNLTLHYHDVPDHLPAELVYRMFACDLEAMGIKGGHVCTHGAGTAPQKSHTPSPGTPREGWGEGFVGWDSISKPKR